MQRAALFALLVASTLCVSVQAQRGGAAGHGNAGGRGVRSGSIGQHGLPGRFSTRRGSLQAGFNRRNGFGPAFLPYGDSSGYEQSEPEVAPNGPVPAGAALRVAEPPVPKAQIIEIPSVSGSTPAKVLPPTIFILANGERLEARRFVLTATLLSVSVDRQRRNVPLDMLDIKATVATNHERGIDLQIPDDRNEISLSF